MKAVYSSLVRRGSGMSLRNSFSSAATSWTLCSSSSCTSIPRSNSSRSCRKKRKEERDSETSFPPKNRHYTYTHRLPDVTLKLIQTSVACALISRIWPIQDDIDINMSLTYVNTNLIEISACKHFLRAKVKPGRIREKKSLSGSRIFVAGCLNCIIVAKQNTPEPPHHLWRLKL